MGDILKSGADYTHVSTSCQPIFMSVKSDQYWGMPVILILCKQLETGIEAD